MDQPGNDASPTGRAKNLHQRVAKLRAKAPAMGISSPEFDMKKFTDEEWDAPKGDFSKTDLDLA